MHRPMSRAIVAMAQRMAAHALVVALLIATPTASAAPCAGFTDVDTSSGFCGNVGWLKNRSIRATM